MKTDYIAEAKDNGVALLQTDGGKWTWEYGSVMTADEAGVGPWDTEEEAAQDVCEAEYW